LQKRLMDSLKIESINQVDTNSGASNDSDINHSSS